MSEQPIVVTGIRPGTALRLLEGCEGRQTPVADWLCHCGYHERATGKAAVEALLARAHVGICTHTVSSKEAA